MQRKTKTTKVVSTTPANSVIWSDLPPLSFDGGYKGSGGFGDWYPKPLPEEERYEVIKENGQTLRSDLAHYVVGCRIGAQAAKELIERHRIVKSNFWQDEEESVLSRIVLAMAEPCDCPERRRGEIIGFFNALHPYFCFGARNVTEADKSEHAKR